MNLEHQENPQVEELLKDKYGISIKDCQDFGTVTMNGPPVKKAVEILNLTKDIVTFKQVTYKGVVASPLTLAHKLPDKIETSLSVEFECSGQDYGKSKILTVFHFELPNGQEFQIGNKLFFVFTYLCTMIKVTL